MRIWRFTGPRNSNYASAERRGSWTESIPVGVCPECTSSRERRTRPLVMVWEPGSDLVGDFVWPGFGSEVVVAENVFAAFELNFGGFDRGPVETIEESDIARMRGPRVRLPYEGPALYELWIATCIAADLPRSTITLRRSCGTCGTEFW